jgi:hypothetical protein
LAAGFAWTIFVVRGVEIRRKSRPLPAHPRRTAAIHYVRFTSIVLKNSEIEAPRKSRFRARHVISTGSPHGTAYGSGVRGNARLSADPLRNFSSWLPAVL